MCLGGKATPGHKTEVGETVACGQLIARAAGFPVGNTPEVGAIACWDNGAYGHVAVVTEVEHHQKIPN